MTIMHYLQETLEKKVSNELNDVEKLYDVKLKGESKKITDSLNESISFQHKSFIRLLSKDEVLEANNGLNLDATGNDESFDFVERKLIPIFDIGENDFVCYDVENDLWVFFNSVDELIFKKRVSVIECFL